MQLPAIRSILQDDCLGLNLSFHQLNLSCDELDLSCDELNLNFSVLLSIVVFLLSTWKQLTKSGRSACLPDSGGSGLPRPASRISSQIASFTRVRTRKSDGTSGGNQLEKHKRNI